MKKLGQFLSVPALSAALLAGHGGSKKAESDTARSSEVKTENMVAGSQELKVITTILPEYDWTKVVLGDKAENVEFALLLENSMDLHSFQSSAEDIAKTSEVDLLIYVGGEFDGWVDDALKEVENKNMKVTNFMEILSDKAKEEGIKEDTQGSEDEHDHNHDKEVSTFEDSEVRDRILAGWEGDWQSAYLLAKSGAPDVAFKEKAEKTGKMTAGEYKTYYIKDYETDIAKINTGGDTVSFTDKSGRTVRSPCEYISTYIQDWSTGTKATIYHFETEDKDSGAPIYVESNNHITKPATTEYPHTRSSNESFDAIKDPRSSWPTFCPAVLMGGEVTDEFTGHDHHEGTEYDEHVWFLLKNTELYVDKIAEDLSALDTANVESYEKSTEAYNKELSELGTQYTDIAKNTTSEYLLFDDRSPFRYLAGDYGLDYSAASVSCSVDTEVGFETIHLLAGKVDEKKLGSIPMIEDSNQKIVNTIQQNIKKKNQEILVLDFMWSMIEKNMTDGETYFGMMKKNLEVLKQVL